MSAVTTFYMEMRDRAELRPRYAEGDSFKVEEVSDEQWVWSRRMYKEVGGPWSWTDRLPWTDAEWQEYAADPGLRTFLAYEGDALVGYFELRVRDTEVEILYFGLLSGHTGKGLGGPLLTRALEEAWDMAPTRVWLHTCTLDHPAALKNYERRGLKIYDREED